VTRAEVFGEHVGASEYVTNAGLLWEENKDRVKARQRQIEIGKNTLGYQRYTEKVPREKRRWNHPVTPDARVQQSKRRFAGAVSAWRRKLYEWDPQGKAPRQGGPRQDPSQPRPKEDVAEVAADLNQRAGLCGSSSFDIDDALANWGGDETDDDCGPGGEDGGDGGGVDGGDGGGVDGGGDGGGVGGGGHPMPFADENHLAGAAPVSVLKAATAKSAPHPVPPPAPREAPGAGKQPAPLPALSAPTAPGAPLRVLQSRGEGTVPRAEAPAASASELSRPPLTGAVTSACIYDDFDEDGLVG